MNKINLIVGTYNQWDPSLSQTELESVYEHSYKPFLTLMSQQPVARFVCYYASFLLEWLNRYHPESIHLLRELIQKNQLELLVAGYSEPVFSFLSPKDRNNQYEAAFALQRSLFSKKFHGGFLPNQLWEPTYASALKKNSIHYFFIASECFYRYGFTPDHLKHIFMTEDQGELLFVFPIFDFFPDLFLRTPNDRLIKEMIRYSGITTPNFPPQPANQTVLSFLMNGNQLGKPGTVYEHFFLSKKLDSFLELIQSNRSLIKTELAHSCLRLQTAFPKVYFGAFHDSAFNFKMSPAALEPFFHSLWVQMDETKMGQYLEKGHFRQFLSKYPEASRLYAKTLYISRLFAQYKSDKERKKLAEAALMRAQVGFPYLVSDTLPGIFSNSCRKAVYAALLETEKLLRDKFSFTNHLMKTDFDLDGTDEFLFSSHHFNAYVDRLGGEIFELDYFPARTNYVDTFSRFSIGEDENVRESRFPSHLFCDFFFSKDSFSPSAQSLSAFFPATDSAAPPASCFFPLQAVPPLYPVADFDASKRTLVLLRQEDIHDRGACYPVELSKSFFFGKNILLSYTFSNPSDDSLSFYFASFLNFSFPHETDYRFTLLPAASDPADPAALVAVSVPSFHTDVRAVHLEQCSKGTLIQWEADRPCSLFADNVFSTLRRQAESVSVFQQLCLIPLWEVSIPPKGTWSVSLSLSLSLSKK